MTATQPISKRAALQRMRALSEQNIPFSFGFITCNTTKGTTKGYKVIDKALLRPGMSSSQSNLSDVLIGYIDYDDASTDKNRWFYYPLLMMFNGQQVQP